MNRTNEDAKLIIESVKPLQERGVVMPCPRCGRNTMNSKLVMNALSRYATLAGQKIYSIEYYEEVEKLIVDCMKVLKTGSDTAVTFESYEGYETIDLCRIFVDAGNTCNYVTASALLSERMEADTRFHLWMAAMIGFAFTHTGWASHTVSARRAEYGLHEAERVHQEILR